MPMKRARCAISGFLSSAAATLDAGPMLISVTGLLLLSRADPDRHVRSTSDLQESGHQLGTVDRVPRRRCHESQIELRGFEQQRESPGVVDVRADVRVQDDGDHDKPDRSRTTPGSHA